MSSANADTVFCKAVCNTMLAYGYPVQNMIQTYVAGKKDIYWFGMREWKALMEDVCSALRKDVQSKPQRVLHFLVDVTGYLQHGAMTSYMGMMRKLCIIREVVTAWKYVGNDDNARYAFAVFMLSVGCVSKSRTLFSEVTSVVLERPFELSEHLFNNVEAFSIAMFGPAWHLLHINEGLPQEEFIDLILVDRPPFVGRPVQAVAVVQLPQDIVSEPGG